MGLQMRLRVRSYRAGYGQLLEPRLQARRRAVQIDSACRCKKLNAAEGSKPGSDHTPGEAVDIKVHNAKHRYFVLVELFGAGFKRIGLGSNFVNADVAENLPQQVT